MKKDNTKPKNPIGWKQYFLEFKQRDGASYRKLARVCNRSDAAVHALVSGVRPPTYSIAKKIAKEMGMNEQTFLNIVFRDRLLHFLEKEDVLSESPTEEIRKFVDAIQKWAPENGKKIRYIMLTFKNNLGTNCAKKNNDLEGPDMGLNSSTLNEPLRQSFLPCEAETAQGEFFAGLGGGTSLHKRL